MKGVYMRADTDEVFVGELVRVDSGCDDYDGCNGDCSDPGTGSDGCKCEDS
jgi:hypothetical protein